MAGTESENEMVKCPKKKVHLGGPLKGQVISFAIFPYHETKCPLSMKCSDPCKYKKSI